MRAHKGCGYCSQVGRERCGLQTPGLFPTAYLLLFALSQEGHEAQHPAEVPLPEGHL